MVREYEMPPALGGHEAELTVIWLPGDAPHEVVEWLLRALGDMRGSSVMPLSSMSHALWLQSGSSNRRAAPLLPALGAGFAPSTPCYLSEFDVEVTPPQSVQQFGGGRLFLQEPRVASVALQLRLVYRPQVVALTATQMLGQVEPRIRRLVFNVTEDFVHRLDRGDRRMLDRINESPYIGATLREIQRAGSWFIRHVIEAAGEEGGRYGEWVVIRMDMEYDRMRLERSVMVEIARPDYARELQELRRNPPSVNPSDDFRQILDLYAGTQQNFSIGVDLASPDTSSWEALRRAVVSPLTGRRSSAATPPPPAEPPAPPPLPKLPGNRIIKLPKP